jgi:glycosyltransferase involved in cell wall biosynthesis
MRIGFLIYGDINTISGGYLYDRKIIEYLRLQGDKVTIINLKQNNYFQDILSNQTENIINTSDFDILIEDELIHPSVFKTNRILNTKLPVISLVHLFRSFSTQPNYINWFYQFIEKKYLSSVNGIILNSKSTQEQARQLMRGNLADNIIALPAGNNFLNSTLDRINSLKRLAPQPLRILYIGNVIQQKGLHILLHALSELKTEDFRLSITGRTDMDSAYVKKIHSIIKKNHLFDQIEFTGPLPGDALPDQYRNHHIMVLPSENEAYGIVYLEAMQFGLPVIGTTSGGAKEIINHGENGFLIPPGDVKQLATHLSNLINMPDKLAVMGENAIHSYKQHPTWNNTGELIREFLLKFAN